MKTHPGAITVMVIDDDRDFLTALCKILSQEGFRVISADNGPEAIYKLVNYAVDLVISDLRMSPISGSDLFYECKSRMPDLPFLLITGHPRDLSIDESFRSGFTMLEKPFEPSQLLGEIRRIFPNLADNSSKDSGRNAEGYFS